MRKIFFLVLLLVFFVSKNYAQTGTDTLTNKVIIQLKNAGFGNDLIKTKIQNSVCHFDLSTDALIALKKAGISDDLIATMLNSVNSALVMTNTATPDDSLEKVKPGIYYCKGDPCSFKELDASVYAQAKVGAGVLTRLTYGIAKTKMKARLSGKNTNLQLREKGPVFYFYFDQKSQSNFNNAGAQPLWFASASTPNEFLLIRFAVSGNGREVVTGTWGSYAGLSSGIEEKSKVAFKYEKVSPGVYKVYAEAPLRPGEYCFMYAGGTATYGVAPMQKVYDFGIE